ncbi:ubiquinol oxidase subunit II [Ramlibacter sp. XY19]|uniref:ubiquinol oxidase subunit II n=1 Tax=Ramlibacter paludis TaxID=2908000 RepID=UPI0023DBEF59|nr:ubiquinol oxidase subunit II [Ramlibacter paludis]MCG2595450.1 ubiquinol oxidase subunit II [Ramlibacter paludis]
MKKLLAIPCAALLSGCSMVVLDPAGHIAAQEARLLVISTLLMLLIIVPVIALTLLFAWRYRASNTDAPYEPDWDHSIQLELVIWSAPLLIIIALGAITWIGTHTLNPYRPLDAKAAAAQVEPIDVQVVALDWKWLFIYPKLGIATVNELAAPVDVPVRFSITSASVMNSFYIPALAGQIYAMPTMETKLHAVINQPGVYQGISANYSGAGFSDMHFMFHGLAAADFEAWVQKARASGQALARDTYLQLERPSQREPARFYASVAPGLFDAVVNRCVAPGTQCLHTQMAADERRAAVAANWRPGTPPEGLICTAADAATVASLPWPERK